MGAETGYIRKRDQRDACRGRLRAAEKSRLSVLIHLPHEMQTDRQFYRLWFCEFKRGIMTSIAGLTGSSTPEDKVGEVQRALVRLVIWHLLVAGIRVAGKEGDRRALGVRGQEVHQPAGGKTLGRINDQAVKTRVHLSL